MTLQAPRLDLVSKAAALLADATIVMGFAPDSGVLAQSNAQAAKAFGQDEIPQASFADIFPTAAQDWHNALEGETCAISGSLRHADGTFLGINGVIAGAGGRGGLVYFMGVPTCTSEHDVALMVHRFDAINHALAICQYAADGNVLAGNARFFDLVGVTQDDLVGKPFTVLRPEMAADQPAAEAYWARFAAGQHDVTIRKYRNSSVQINWLR